LAVAIHLSGMRLSIKSKIPFHRLFDDDVVNYKNPASPKYFHAATVAGKR